MPSLQLKKRAPSLALAADLTTKQRMAHKVKNAPFSLIGSLSFVSHPMNKCPHALLRAFASDKHNVSKWMFTIMSDALNLMVALGFVAR
jgi:hypothetical protein